MAIPYTYCVNVTPMRNQNKIFGTPGEPEATGMMYPAIANASSAGAPQSMNREVRGIQHPYGDHTTLASGIVWQREGHSRVPTMRDESSSRP